jgi:hypothetical protein
MAVGSALVGWIVFAAATGSPATGHAHEDSFQSGGLVLTVNEVARVSGGHDDMSGAAQPSYGFPMPQQAMQQMMPGMQAEDEQRLHVEVSLRNPGGTPKRYRPEDFHLVSGAGGRWLPKDPFTPGTLAPGFALTVDLYFDFPQGEADLSVDWTPAGGDPVLIPLVVGDTRAGSGHDHASSGAPPVPAHTHGPGEAPGHTHGP